MNDSKSCKAVCFGEVLWDVFPDHKTIGGAPLNVALRLHSFGVHTAFISSVGNDHNGKMILGHLEKNNLDTANIQLNEQYKTGAVNVTLNKKGSASYEIKYPVAWDKIQLTEEAIEAVKESDAFVFGSLACRDDIAKNTLLSLLDFATFKVFDVNLRPPHYSIDLLVELMLKADFIKCNDEELLEICNHFGKTSSNMEDMIIFLAKKTMTNQLCVTLGKYGASLYIDGNFYRNNGYSIKVADTVGAGDSFLGTLIAKLITTNQPELALNYACAIGAYIASKKGANPKINLEEIDKMMVMSS